MREAKAPTFVLVPDTDVDPDPVVADIYNEWDWVKVGVDEILNTVPYLSFRAEDVYALCKSEQAILWTIQDGFIITTTETDEFSGDKTLLLWLAWVKERGGTRGVKHTEFFGRIAKEHGYKYLQIRSSVPALQSYLLDTGWDIDTIVYTRPVT
jgi:hypothetical protein